MHEYKYLISNIHEVRNFKYLQHLKFSIIGGGGGGAKCLLEDEVARHVGAF